VAEVYDFLVIGGGLAGLTFALHAARRGRVLVLTKADRGESASELAQGGIATVMDRDDSFQAHIEDTLRAGAGLCNEEVVKKCIEMGPQAIQKLVDLGVPFTRRDNGGVLDFDLGREGGHSHRRVLHAGDFTGQEIMRSLVQAAGREPNITMVANKLAVNLIVERRQGDRPEGIVRGVYALDRASGRVEVVAGRCTVLATGGAGKVYLYTSNPDVASGDGMAMAARAGAEMANLEFVQFHPTCLYHPQARNFLLSEALRGEGGKLRLRDGTEFMKKYHSMGDLATRDIVARAIDFELKRTGDDYVLLDMTGVDGEHLKKRFPNLYQRCLELGFDMTRQPLPVVPAAHYFCGGVRTDLSGRTSLPGLYAIGETACTGFHGANRLASNSLLEGLVFGQLAAEDAAEWLRRVPEPPGPIPEWDVGSATDPDESVVVSHNWEEIRRLMWNYVGIVRSNKRLERAWRRIAMIQEEIREYYWNFLLTPDLVELRNIATVAALVIFCASRRRESRGLHYNIDYPKLLDRAADTVVRMLPDGTIEPAGSALPYGWGEG
jgi:L-aspartate oxidase